MEATLPAADDFDDDAPSDARAGAVVAIAIGALALAALPAAIALAFLAGGATWSVEPPAVWAATLNHGLDIIRTGLLFVPVALVLRRRREQ